MILAMNKIKIISFTIFSLALAAAFAHKGFENNNSRPNPLNSSQHISTESSCIAATQQQPAKLKILYSDVIIVGPNGKQLSFDYKAKKIQPLSTIFGNPKRIVDFYYEMDDLWVKKWEYPGAVFYILPDGYFDAFEITGPGFTLNVKGAILEVGKPIGALASAFPNYANYIIEGSHIGFTFKTPDGELVDEFLSIEFDLKTKNILWMRNGTP